MLVGFLHRGGLSFWSYAIASEVVVQGVEFVRFTKDDVDFSNQTIAGEVWENGEWVPRQTRLPEAIRNFERHNFDEKDGDRVLEYRPYTIGRVVSKDEQLRMLPQNPVTRSMVPETLMVHEDLDIMALLQQWGAAILKPARGRLGQGIVFMRCNDGKFEVELDGALQTQSQEQVQQLIAKLKGPESRDYLLQQFAAGMGPDNCYYNVRVIVQKSGDGDWHSCNAPISLLARRGSVIANRDAGAQNIDLLPFLEWRFEDRTSEICDKLYGAAVDFCRVLDDAVAGEADELALDLAIDDHGAIWFHEGNWRGGHWLLQEDSGMYRSGGAHLVQLGEQYRAGSNLDRAEATRIAAGQRTQILRGPNAPGKDSGVVFGISLPRCSNRTATLAVTAACQQVSIIGVSAAASFRAAQRALGQGLAALAEQLPQQARPSVLSRAGYCIHDPLDQRSSTSQIEEDLLEPGLIDNRDFVLGTSTSPGFLEKCVADNCRDLCMSQLDYFVVEGFAENLGGRPDWRERLSSTATEMGRLTRIGKIRQWGFALTEDELQAPPGGSVSQLIEACGHFAPTCVVIDLKNQSGFDSSALETLVNLPLQVFLQLPAEPTRRREWQEHHPSAPLEQLTSTLSRYTIAVVLCPTADLQDLEQVLPVALPLACYESTETARQLRQLERPPSPAVTGKHYPRQALAALQRLARFDHRQIFRLFVDGRFHDKYRGWSGYEANETGSVKSMLNAYSHMMRSFDLSDGLRSSYIREIHLTCMSNVGTANRKSTPGEIRSLEAGFNLFASTTTRASIEELLNQRRGDGTAIFHAEGFYKTADEFTVGEIFDAIKKRGRLRYRPWYPNLSKEDQIALDGKASLDDYYRVKHSIQRGFTSRVEALVARYNKDIALASDEDTRLVTIAGFARDLELLHPFPDGNGRTIIGTLMPHLLLFNGFLPPILYDPNIDLELSHQEFAQEIRRGIDNTEILLKNPEASLYNYAISEASAEEVSSFEAMAEDFVVQLASFEIHPDHGAIPVDPRSGVYLHLTPDRLRSACEGHWINISLESAAQLRFSALTISPTGAPGQLLFCRELEAWKKRGIDVLTRLEKAADEGVFAVVIDDLSIARQLKVPALYVRDVGDALRAAASYVREAVNCRAIVIAGSVGKTSAKLGLKSILSSQAEINASADSGNKTPHVLASLANQRNTDNLDITEIDIGTRPNVARYRSNAVRANICLFISMGPVHHGDDKSMSDVIEAHAAAADGLRPGGLCLVNSSSEYASSLIKTLQSRSEVAIQTFGETALDQAHILSAEYSTEKKQWHVTADILGKHISYQVRGAYQHGPISSLGLLHTAAVLGYNLEHAAEKISQLERFFGGAELWAVKQPEKAFLLYEHFQHGGIEEFRSVLDDLRTNTTHGQNSCGKQQSNSQVRR